MRTPSDSSGRRVQGPASLLCRGDCRQMGTVSLRPPGVDSLVRRCARSYAVRLQRMLQHLFCVVPRNRGDPSEAGPPKGQWGPEDRRMDRQNRASSLKFLFFITDVYFQE